MERPWKTCHWNTLEQVFRPVDTTLWTERRTQVKMISLSPQASARWPVTCISNPLTDGSSPSPQRVSTSSPKVEAQGSSRSPSRTPPVERWVRFNLNFMFLFVVFKKNSFLLNCDSFSWNKRLDIPHTPLPLYPPQSNCSAVSAYRFTQFVCHVDHIII